MKWVLKYLLYILLFLFVSCNQANKQVSDDFSHNSATITESEEVNPIAEDKGNNLLVDIFEEEDTQYSQSIKIKTEEEIIAEIYSLYSSNETTTTLAADNEESDQEPALPISIETSNYQLAEHTSQSGPKPDEHSHVFDNIEIYSHVNIMPSFPGGESELKRWMKSNLRYPRMAVQNNIEGKVMVRFVVLSNGKIGNTEILRSVNPLLDQEALRVIRSMPDWNPGKLDETPVPVWKVLPVVFTIQ
jgi:TonB family C-terminal domain